MVARGREEAQGSDSFGEEIEQEVASILAAGAKAETAGNGQGTPATARAIRRRESEVRERERGAKRSGSTRPVRAGLTRGARTSLQFF